MNACEQSIRTEWGQALCPYDPASIAAWPLGESNMLFLTQVGLPRHATDGGNLAIEFLVPAQFRFIQAGEVHGVCIGETDVGVPVVVEPQTGYVIAGDATGSIFCNASLEALLCSMAMYRREFVTFPLSVEEEGESDDDDLLGTPATRARAERLRVCLNEIDPLALAAPTQGENVSMWGYVVEEVEFGVI